jgi:hypothetical protein
MTLKYTHIITDNITLNSLARYNKQSNQSLKKINQNGPGCMPQKQGRNWDYWAQNAVKVVKFIKIVCFPCS